MYFNTELKAIRAKWLAMKNTSIKNFIPKVVHSQATSKHWAVHPTVIHDMGGGINSFTMIQLKLKHFMQTIGILLTY